MLKLEQVPDTVAWKLHNKLWGSSQFSVEEGRAAIACVEIDIDVEEGHGL